MSTALLAGTRKKVAGNRQKMWSNKASTKTRDNVRISLSSCSIRLVNFLVLFFYYVGVSRFISNQDELINITKNVKSLV